MKKDSNKRKENLLLRLFHFQTIKDLLTFYAALVGIISILVVSGLLNIPPQVEVKMLDPIIYIDVKGLKQEFIGITGKPLCSSVEKMLSCYTKEESYIEIGVPMFQAKHERIINDGQNLNVDSILKKDIESVKYELGWGEKPPWWNYLPPDVGLISMEDRRKGVAYYISRNAREDLPFVKMPMTRKSVLQYDIFKTFIDSIGNEENGYEFYTTFLKNREIYNIISLENKSNQKVYDIVLRLNTTYLGGKPELIAWTHSPELVEQDTATAYLTTFRIPFLRPKASIEFIIRSKHLYRTDDIVIEWNRLKNLSMNGIKTYLIIIFVFSLLYIIIDKIFISPRLNK